MEYVALFVYRADCGICLRQFAVDVNPVSNHKAGTALSFRTRDIFLCCDQQWWLVCFWRARRSFGASFLYRACNLTNCHAHLLVFCALGGGVNVGAFHFCTQLLFLDQLAKSLWRRHVG